MEMGSEPTHPGLVATEHPEWGDGFRHHVEELVRRLESAAVRLGAGLLPVLGGGLVVELYGGKGFSLLFDGAGMPTVLREPSDVRPERGLFIRCEMWALDALLDPTTDVEKEDPETFFVMAGWEMEGDFALLQRLDRVCTAAQQGQSGTSTRIGAMLAAGKGTGDDR